MTTATSRASHLAKPFLSLTLSRRLRLYRQRKSGTRGTGRLIATTRPPVPGADGNRPVSESSFLFTPAVYSSTVRRASKCFGVFHSGWMNELRALRQLSRTGERTSKQAVKSNLGVCCQKGLDRLLAQIQAKWRLERMEKG